MELSNWTIAGIQPKSYFKRYYQSVHKESQHHTTVHMDVKEEELIRWGSKFMTIKDLKMKYRYVSKEFSLL